MFTPKNILVPTDFSVDSDRALQEAVDIAKPFGAKIYLIHVDRKVQEGGADYALGAAEIQAIERLDASTAAERMRSEVEKITKNAAIEIEIAERHGKTHEEILAYGKEKAIDLIVVEPHAKKGLLKSLLGGVADKLAQKSFCSVLVLH